MNILICTQAVDRTDSILGFFCDWIEEFAKRYDHVTVIALRKGTQPMPANVVVYTLPKGRLLRVLRLCLMSGSMRKQYDAVFAHMNPEYVVAAGWLWRLLRKPVTLWYAHGSVDIKLRVAERFADIVFTPSKESFRIDSKKTRIVGHGIDSSQFEGAGAHLSGALLCVGRISRVKNFDLMFDALSQVAKSYPNVTLSVIGEPLTSEDRTYYEILKSRVAREQLSVIFRGALPHREVSNAIRDADVFLSCSRTGSLDKTILEAWAGGLYVVTTNDGARSAAAAVDKEMPLPEEADRIMSCITLWFALPEKAKENYRTRARAYVKDVHGLSRLISDISAYINELAHND